MGLNPDQVNEIAKLPKGVAVVYQNEWLSPVLTMVHKANVVETGYVNQNSSFTIKPLKKARTELISALLQPWIKHERITRQELRLDLQSLDLSRSVRNKVSDYIDIYSFLGGKIIWKVEEIPNLQEVIKKILYISDEEFYATVQLGANSFQEMIAKKTTNLTKNELNEVCNVLTKVVGNNGNN